GDGTTVNRRHRVAARIREENRAGGATRARHSRGFPPHCDAGAFQPGRQCIERRCVSNFPTKKTLSIRQSAIDDQTLLPVVHTEGMYCAATINRLQPKLAGSKTGPVIEL